MELTLQQEEVQSVFHVYYYNKLDATKIIQNQPQTTSTKATTHGQSEQNGGDALSDDD